MIAWRWDRRASEPREGDTGEPGRDPRGPATPIKAASCPRWPQSLCGRMSCGVRRSVREQRSPEAYKGNRGLTHGFAFRSRAADLLEHVIEIPHEIWI